MSTLLENAIIKFDLNWSKSLLAKVTVNFDKVFEVRFFRISMRDDGSYYFQPPAIQIHGWKKCFIVLDKDEWQQFSDRVLKEFEVELKKQEEDGLIPSPILDKLHSFQEQQVTDEDLVNIDKELSKDT